MGYPYFPEDHRKRFCLIHNADCTKPLERGVLTVGDEYWLEPTGENEYVLSRATLEYSLPKNNPYMRMNQISILLPDFL